MAAWSEYVLSGSTPPAVGRIIAESDRSYEVRWADGRQTTAKPGSGPRRVLIGSAAERYAQDPPAFAQLFENDPVELFAITLIGAPDGSKPADIQRRLIELGLDADLVKSAWAKSRSTFDKHPHVVKERGTYRWSDQALDPLSWIDELGRLDTLRTVAQGKNVAAEKARLEARLAALEPEPWTDDERLLAWAVGRSDEVPAPAVGAPSALDEKSLAIVLSRAEKDARFDVLRWIAALPGRGKPATAAMAALPPVERAVVVDAALEDLARTSASRPTAAWALAVVERLGDLPDGVTPELARRLVRLRLSPTLADRPEITGCLETVLSPSRADVDLVRAEAASMADFDPRLVSRGEIRRTSFRIRLLTALIGTAHEATLDMPLAWQGLDLDALLELVGSAHPLTGHLVEGSNPPGVRVATTWLASSSPTLATLGRVLGWPRPLLAALPVELLTTLVAQVRADGGLAERLLADPRVDTLQQAVNLADARSLESLASVTVERDSLREQLTSVERRLDGAEARLREAHGASETAYTSQLRQSQIDAVRALCTALDRVFEVEGSVDQAGSIWASAVASVGAFGIQTIGTVGQIVDVDVVDHELLGGPGFERARVRRPGYAWVLQGERLVITRALVSPEA